MNKRAEPGLLKGCRLILHVRMGLERMDGNAHRDATKRPVQHHAAARAVHAGPICSVAASGSALAPEGRTRSRVSFMSVRSRLLVP